MKKIISKLDNNTRREKFMSSEDIDDINDFLHYVSRNRNEMKDLYTRWEEEEEAYAGDQPKKSGRPNTRVNIINANIEGQISAIIDQNLALTTMGDSPSDEMFSDYARIGLEWTLKKNKIKKVIESHERKRLKFGVGIFKNSFDPNAISGFGIVKLESVPLTKIFIDRKIRDHLKFQDAEYIAETIRLSNTQFIKLYGEEKAETILYGEYGVEETTTFDDEYSEDDENSAILIQYWTRNEGKLRLVEFTGCGLLLYDSQRSGDRKTNQKDIPVVPKSYYKYVNDDYPYFFTNLYSKEGELYGFGDCKLLRPINDMINDLYDKIRITARPNLILFDESSEVNLDSFDDDSLSPRAANLTSSRGVEVIKWGDVNPAYWQLISSMHQEAQRVTRFSDLMIGQGRSADTATEASIQQQQGNAVTEQKKIILESTLVDVCEYMLGLMMQFYNTAKTFRFSSDSNEFKWIDFRKLTQVPVMKPVSESYRKSFEENNEGKRVPEWEILEEDGNPLTKNVDLSIDITIGSGLPKNKTFLWQMIQQLSQIVVQDANGQPKNLISFEELRSFVKEYLGLPLDDKTIEQMGLSQQQQMGTQGVQSEANALGELQNANVPLSANGNPLSASGG